MNLVDLVKDQLGGNVLTKLAETLETSPDNTRTAVNAAVPTLLTALGINPDLTLHTPLGRPVQLAGGGRAVHELFA